MRFKRKKRIEWVENVISLDEIQNRRTSTPKTASHLGSSFSSKKAFFFIFFVFILFAIIIFRLIVLQIIEGEKYKRLAENNRQRVVPIPSERGDIFDKNGIQLTKNIPNFSLALLPQQLPRNRKIRKKIIKRLSELTKKSEIEINQILEDYGSYSYESIVIQENLDYETALSIQIAASDLPGLYIERSSKRLYLLNENNSDLGMSASHIIGYEGKIDRNELNNLRIKGYIPSDHIGKTGIEKEYEEFLRGTYGSKKLEIDAYGREQSIISETAPKPGKHIRLNLDMNIQKKLEELLKQSLAKNKKRKAAGIVMDPQTGKILSLVSLPAFDNNDFSGGISSEIYNSYVKNPDKPLFNRAISGTYPSGSTIKPAIAAAALEEGIINSKTSFLSTGGVKVNIWFFPDWLAGGHGITDVRKSIAWSVNTFYYYIGGGYGKFKGLGVKKITEYLRLFGFAEKLGIDLPAEQAGFLPSKKWKEKVKKERWYVGDTYNLSIGQGDLLVTPLQIAGMTSIIANGGTLYKPHIAESLIDPITGYETRIEKEIIRKNIISPAHLRTVRLGMRDCVIYGSCRRLASLPISVAGKTGTAQWSNIKEPHAWFTSFAPYDNPMIVLTILIEEGKGGSQTAAPVAEQFYKWWADYKS